MLGIIVGSLSFVGIVLYFLAQCGFFGRRSSGCCSDCSDCSRKDCGEKKIYQITPLDPKQLLLVVAALFLFSGCQEKTPESALEPPKPSFVVQLSDSDFLERTRKGVVLLDAYADWCGPCRMMEPELEKVAETLQGKVVVARINVDANKEFARYYRVELLPTLFVFVDGKLIGKPALGLHSEQQLLGLVEKYIPKEPQEPKAVPPVSPSIPGPQVPALEIPESQVPALEGL